MGDRTDQDLIRAVLAGDTEAYAGLVRRYRDRYGRFAVRMLGDIDDAEEALQDAFVRAYRSLARCEHPERFDVWFYRILANRCRTTGGRRGRRERTFVRDENALDRAAAPDVVDRLIWREELERALGALDDDQREAFLLKHVENRSYEEIAQLTGAGISALKMRVKRACDRMRGILVEVDDV